MRTRDANLYDRIALVSEEDNRLSNGHDTIKSRLTVDVTSIEHTSQWNLVPASVPREAVFLRITPISPPPLSSSGLSGTVSRATDSEVWKY